MILLADGGYLVRPSVENARKQDDMKVQLWGESGVRLEVLLPGLMAELFPPSMDPATVIKEEEQAGKA